MTWLRERSVIIHARAGIHPVVERGVTPYWGDRIMQNAAGALICRSPGVVS